MGQLQFGFHPYYRFPIISLHLKGIAGHCTQVPLWGSHPGERHVRASDSTTKSMLGSASVRTEPEVDRVYHIDPANALETKWFL